MVNSIGNPPSRLVRFSTRDRDEASELVSAAQRSAITVDFHGRTDAFSMNYAAVSLGEVKILKIEMAAWTLRRNMEGFVLIHFPTKGRVAYRNDRINHEVAGAMLATAAAPRESVSLTSSGGGALALYLPAAKLIERAEKIAGKSFGPSLMERMARVVDLTTPVGAALARNIRSTLAEMTALDAIGVGELARTGYEETLVNLAAAALFPEILAANAPYVLDAGPAAIRKARAFITRNASGHVDFAHLARDLGLSMRAMQENFRKYVGASPRDYLMECRLEIARQKLLLTDKVSSITEIALASGFPDHSHFSARYRARYGELPSETMRHARS